MNNAPSTENSRPWIQSWLIWFVAALFPMYQFMLQGSPSVMLGELIHDLDISLVEASFITTFFFYTYIIMQIPSGILVDHFGPRILITLGAFFAGVACLIFSCCKLLWLAEMSRLIMGFVCATGIVSVFYLVTQWFEAKRFALMVGMTEALCMGGAALSTILLSASVRMWGWRKAVFLSGMGGIIIALLMVFIVHNRPKDYSWILKNNGQFSLKDEGSKLLKVIANSQVWINGMYMGMAFSIVPAFFALWGIPFFMKNYQLNSTAAATVNAAGLLGVGIGSPFLGWLSDKIKRRKIITNISSLFAILSMGFILFLKPPLSLAFFVNFLLGFGCSGYVLSFAIIKEILPQKIRGRAIGFANMLCLAIGAPVLQPVIAMLIKYGATADPTFTHVLVPIPITLIAAFILTFFIKETYCQDIEHLGEAK